MKKKLTAICLCVALVAIAVVGASLAYFTDTTEKVTNTFTMGGVDIKLEEQNWNADASHKLMPGVTFEKDPTITVEDGSDDSYVFLEMSFNKFSSLLWVMAADADADDSINFTLFDTDAAGNKTLKEEFKNDSGVFSTTKFIEAAQKNKTVFQAIVNKWFGNITHTDWEVLSFKWGADNTDTNLLTVKLAYIGGENKGVLKAGESVTFMKSFGMPSTVTSEMIDSGDEIGGMANDFNTIKKDFEIHFTAYAVQAEGFGSAAEAWNNTFGA